MAGEKILIVENEGIVLLNLRQTFERLGYVVAGTASTGEAAMAMAAELRPDLVLMDIVLHGSIDGIEAADRIRSILHIPIVYLTAYTDDNTRERAKSTQPYGYLVKPFREQDLAITVEFALHKARMEREREELLRRLEAAHTHIKALEGMLPICAWCKKIRNEKGDWISLESYLDAHTNLQLSHGICTDCERRLKSETGGRPSGS